MDRAEDEDVRDKVYAINVLGTRYLAEAAQRTGAKMMYISTDYVFDGQGTEAWEPDDKRYAPINYYGETKLGGEQAVSYLNLIFRICSVKFILIAEQKF